MIDPKTGMYDIYDVAYTPFWQTFWFLLFIVPATVICVTFFIILFKRKKKIEIPYDQYAVAQLKELAVYVSAQEPIDHNQFYKKLALILKYYFSQRYQDNVMSKTDNEVIIYLTTVNFPREYYGIVHEIFNNALFVKFAAQEKAREIMHQDLANSMRIVEQAVES